MGKEGAFQKLANALGQCYYSSANTQCHCERIGCPRSVFKCKPLKLSRRLQDTQDAQGRQEDDPHEARAVLQPCVSCEPLYA